MLFILVIACLLAPNIFSLDAICIFSFCHGPKMDTFRDRFPEFRKFANDAGIKVRALGEQGSDTGSGTGSRELTEGGTTAKRGKGKFMAEFFAEVRQIQDFLASVKRGTDELEALTDDVLQATTAANEKQAQDRVEDIIFDGNDHLRQAKLKIETLIKEDCKKPNEQRVRKNMTQALVKKMQTIVQKFQNAQQVYNKEVKAKTTRQLRIACPNATSEEIAKMIEDGNTRDTVVQKQMAGTHAQLLDSLQEVHDKYRTIRKLEKSMADLHQMFVDMAQLIEHQGEMLDVIEANVGKTKAYTQEAQKELVEARKQQLSANRRMCCLTVFMVVVLFAIMMPVMFGR